MNFFQNRISLLRKTLAAPLLRGFEEAVVRTCNYLDTELLAEFGGLAVFARGGKEPFFLPLQFQVPLPDWIAVGAFPNVFHLVELKDTYHRFVILISTEEKAQILEVTLGEVTQKLWRERPQLQARIVRGWSRGQYQRHRRHDTERFFKEKIEVLEKLMNKGGHKHFILAGSPRLTSQIKQLLPKHLADKLVDSISTSGGDRLSDIVKMAVTMFTEEEEQESRAVVEKLMDEIHANSFGVVGITGTLRVISALLEALPPEERENSKRDLVSYCAKVAEVSGGFIGFFGSRRVCTEERELLARIAAELESSRQESARQIING